jgi:hypothetical protein
MCEGGICEMTANITSIYACEFMNSNGNCGSDLKHLCNRHRLKDVYADTEFKVLIVLW